MEGRQAGRRASRRLLSCSTRRLPSGIIEPVVCGVGRGNGNVCDKGQTQASKMLMHDDGGKLKVAISTLPYVPSLDNAHAFLCGLIHSHHGACFRATNSWVARL